MIEKMFKPEFRDDGDRLWEAEKKFFKSKLFRAYVVLMAGCWITLLLLYVFF